MRSMRILLLAIMLVTIPAASSASVYISVNFGPPALPMYVQPSCPDPGYMWAPGYWAYGPGGYYWVPGVWVPPPAIGLLWTPGYWGFGRGLYFWHPGYWGPRVGYYGGINYGFGYFGIGYVGGYWRGRNFYYNRAVTNVNVTNIRNVYVNRAVINRNTIYHGRASFNGPGGVMAQPNAQQRAAMRERRFGATRNQLANDRAAHADRSQFATVNHGRPAVAAMRTVNGERYNPQGRIAPGPQGPRGGEGGGFHQFTPQERQQVRRQANPGRATYHERRGPAAGPRGNGANRPVNRGRPAPQERRNANARGNGGGHGKGHGPPH